MTKLLLLAGTVTFLSTPAFPASLNLNLGLARPLTSVAGAVVGGATTVAGAAVGQVASGVGADVAQGGTVGRGAALVGVNTSVIGLSDVPRSGATGLSPNERRRYAHSTPLVQFGASPSLLSN